MKNEIEILLEGSVRQKFAKKEILIDEDQVNSNLFLVMSGEFPVYVGGVKVATLIAGDWAGELSVLSNNVSRARIMCGSDSGEISVIDSTKLGAIFAARPDLASTFYAQLAYELALRLNIALIQASHLVKQSSDISVLATSGRHTIRQVQNSRDRVERVESQFRYDADMHAVHAFWCLRLPKDSNKSPRDAIFYVFSTRIANLYHKGHLQSRVAVEFQDIESMQVLAEDPTTAVLRYRHATKTCDKFFKVQFKTAELAASAVQLVLKLRSATLRKEPAARRNEEFRVLEAVAMFDFDAEDPSSQIDLRRGSRYVVLDRLGGWLYGLDPEHPDRKGLFPYAYVEMRPYGVELEGVLQPSDWKEFAPFFNTVRVSRGQCILQEGDPLSQGDLYFISKGRFGVRNGGSAQNISILRPGESVGELLFLLGGHPRASVVALEDHCEVQQLPRSRLAAILSDSTRSVLTSKFWKYLCVMTASRLSFLQLRLKKQPPPVPSFVRVNMSERERKRSKVIEEMLPGEAMTLSSLTSSSVEESDKEIEPQPDVPMGIVVDPAKNAAVIAEITSLMESLEWSSDDEQEEEEED